MKVTLLYLNQKPVERHVKKVARIALIKGYDFTKGAMAQPPFWHIFFGWPSKDALNNLPLQFQCEEVTLQANKLVTVQKLVIDIESSLIKEILLEA